MAYFEQFKQIDGTLLYSGTIAATGAGSAIDTQYYGSVSIQVAGSGSIFAQIEGSNDGSDWDALLLNSTGEIAVTDTINSIDDTFFIKTGHRYIRFNVAKYTGAPTFTIFGRSGTGPSAADNLSMAFNPDTPINVALQNVRRDSSDALILSDAITFDISKIGQYVFDTRGYQSVVLNISATPTGSFTAAFGHDGNLFPITTYFNSVTSTTVFTNNMNAAGTYTTAVLGRYLKIVSPGAATGVATITLKQAPHSLQSTQVNQGLGLTNLTHIGGTATVTGGVAGILAVGGNIAPGTTPTANPLLMGGADLNTLTRRVQTDSAGKPLINALSPYFNTFSNNTTSGISSSNSPGANTVLPINTVGSIPASYQQSAALNVQDTSQFEGQNKLELLAQILLELRILNQQIYELPKTLATSNYGDAPESIRQEPSVFNQ